MDPNTRDPEELRREVAELQEALAKKTAEAEQYKQSAYQFLARLDPYVPPTEEELHDMLHGPRGESLQQVIAEFERRATDSGAADAPN